MIKNVNKLNVSTAKEPFDQIVPIPIQNSKTSRTRNIIRKGNSM